MNQDLGKFPSEWQFKTVDEIKSNCKHAIAMGPFGSNIKTENYVSSGVPVIRGTNLNYYKYPDGMFVFVSEQKANELKASLCVPDDLIFTHRGTLGQVGLIPSNKYAKYLVSQSGMKLSVNKEIINPLFAFYFFKSELGQNQLLQYESQVGVPAISNPLTSLKKIILPIPSLAEQRAIATVLSNLDDKIDLLRRQNATLEAMAEALFKQWFVLDAKEEWEETTIEEAITFYDKRRIPLSQIERDKRKSGILYPYYGAAQIMDYINEYIFDGDYLLIAEDGTVRTDEGYPIIQRTSGKFWVNNHTHIIQAKKPYTNDFIYIYLLKKNIDKIVTGAVQPKISQGNLKKLDFYRYPSSLISQYTHRTKPFFERIRSNQTQIRTLEKLRDTLLPKLMSGEVRVSLD
ncbi:MULTISPECIES: restriction endonuclease subunit S [unclassified Desulfovibrio]|uniref:restriction endonuclease subunit S n=1 Tax=unclassified Desulfovibrio TaxID=2593640 RepID=UPI0013EBCCEB|nr:MULTISPECIES: restriction endonuclease subunit S [unclassified Desulfovibrio]